MTLLSDSELQTRYFDWCSTRIAQRFLQLSPDEVWVRARQAEQSDPPGGAASPAPSDPLPASPAALHASPEYLQLVRRTALVLARELELPDFAEWKERYLRDPAAFEPGLLGAPPDPDRPGAR